MRRIFIVVIVLVAIAILLVFKNNDRLRCEDCNVIIVAYDALQATHVSNLGYFRETTPMLDSLASSGVSFTKAISPSSWTVPTYMSIFTGLYPTEHGVVNKFTIYKEEEKIISNLRELSKEVKTLAEVLKENGYETGGFTGDAGVSSQFGYNLGFDVYTDEQTFGSIENSSSHALIWLKENKDKKFFMFLHGYDSHGQFSTPQNYKGRFMPVDYKGLFKGTTKEQRDLREEGLAKGSVNLSEADVEFWRGLYDSKIRDADDRFAKFWEEFQKLGIKRKTIIIILSDHGTEVYEHKRFDHGFSVYDELVRVPLVFVVPNLSGGKVIDKQVSLLDVTPTIIDLLGLNTGKKFRSQIRGQSLLSYLKGKESPGHDVFIETDYRNYTHKRGIRTQDGWKFIMTMETGQKELYNLNEDPQETKNVIDENLQLAFKLESRVVKHIEEMGDDPYKKWETGCLPVYGDQCQ